MTTTVTTTTVVSVLSAGYGLVLGAILTAALIALLVARELVLASGHPKGVSWARVLGIGISPLAISFALTVAVKIAAAL